MSAVEEQQWARASQSHHVLQNPPPARMDIAATAGYLRLRQCLSRHLVGAKGGYAPEGDYHEPGQVDFGRSGAGVSQGRGKECCEGTLEERPVSAATTPLVPKRAQRTGLGRWSVVQLWLPRPLCRPAARLRLSL